MLIVIGTTWLALVPFRFAAAMKFAVVLPGAAVAAAAIVTAACWPGVCVRTGGVKITFGTAGAFSVIAPAKPFTPEAVKTTCCVAPGVRVTDGGVAVTVKS